jgi:hypothetical protein
MWPLQHGRAVRSYGGSPACRRGISGAGPGRWNEDGLDRTTGAAVTTAGFRRPPRGGRRRPIGLRPPRAARKPGVLSTAGRAGSTGQARRAAR